MGSDYGLAERGSVPSGCAPTAELRRRAAGIRSLRLPAALHGTKDALHTR